MPPIKEILEFCESQLSLRSFDDQMENLIASNKNLFTKSSLSAFQTLILRIDDPEKWKTYLKHQKDRKDGWENILADKLNDTIDKVLEEYSQRLIDKLSESRNTIKIHTLPSDPVPDENHISSHMGVRIARNVLNEFIRKATLKLG